MTRTIRMRQGLAYSTGHMLLCMLTVCSILSGCALADQRRTQSLSGIAEFTFDKYELITGAAKREVVLPGYFLNNDYAELAVVSSGDNCDNRLRFYTFHEGAWKTTLDEPLQPNVLFVDTAKIGGHDRLLIYERGHLNWLDPATATEYPLMAVTPCYSPSVRGEVAHVDITRDLNNDGLDDIVLPGPDGLWVSLQEADGTFAAPTTFSLPTQLQWTDLTNPWMQSRVHTLDYNRDGRSDMVLWNQGDVTVHFQNERGSFAALPTPRRLGVALSSFGHYTLTAEQQDVGIGDRSKRVLSALRDLNGDGVFDMVTSSVKGNNPLTFRSACEIRFGNPSPDGTVFAHHPDAALRSNGIHLGRQLCDFDGDDQVDVMVIACNHFDIFKMVGGMLTGSASLDLELYRMEDGAYPNKPTAVRKIKGVFNADDYYQFVSFVDVNDDGRLDLVVQQGRKELRVFFGIPGPQLFTKQFQRISLPMPDNQRDTRVLDINQDGKSDFVMHQRFTDCYWKTTDPNKPNRITLLITR